MPISNINLGVYNALVDTDVQDAVYSVHGIQDSLYTYDDSLRYIDAITGTNAYGGEVFAVNPSSSFLYVGSGRDVLYYELADEYLPVYKGKVSAVVPSGKYIQTMIIPPGGGHIYIGVNGPDVYLASLDSVTGLLTGVSSTSVSTDTLTSIVGIISSWDSKFLYILGGTSITDGQNVWVYKRDRNTGTLTFVQKNSISHGGIVPKDIKISPNGSILAVAFASEIYIYDVNTTYGRLSYNSKHPKGTRSINAIVFGVDGKYLYAGANGGKLYVYESNVFSGVVQTIDTGAPEALKVAMNYSGTALYAGEITGDTLYKFIVSPLSGQLTASTSTDVPRTNISSIIVNTSGMVPKNYFSQYINTTTMSIPQYVFHVGRNKITVRDENFDVLHTLSMSGVWSIEVFGDQSHAVVTGETFMRLLKINSDYSLTQVAEYTTFNRDRHFSERQVLISSDNKYVYSGSNRFEGVYVYELNTTPGSESITSIQDFEDTANLTTGGITLHAIPNDDEYIVGRGYGQVIVFKRNSTTGVIENFVSKAEGYGYGSEGSTRHATIVTPDRIVLQADIGSASQSRDDVRKYTISSDGIIAYVTGGGLSPADVSIDPASNYSEQNYNDCIAINSDGSKVYISTVTDKIYVVNVSDASITQTYTLPISGQNADNTPHSWSLSYDNDRNELYAMLKGDDFRSSKDTGIFRMATDESSGQISSIDAQVIFTGDVEHDFTYLGENKISVNSTTTNSMAENTAVTDVSPHAEIYLGTGVFDAADATELVPGVPLGVPDLGAIRYAAEIDFTGAELVDLLANVAIKVSKADIDFINADPDRIDSVIAYQTAGSKSFDMKELGNLGVKDATLSGDFDLGDGNDTVAVGGEVGALAIDMANTSNVLPVAAVLPKAIGSAMQLTGGKEEIYRIMVNESDFVNLAKFADDSQGAVSSAGGDPVKLQDLLRAVDSVAGDELQVSEITTDASKALAERKVGHEILLNLFRLSPPRPGPSGATNDDTFTGDADGYWTYDGDDLLKLSKLPEDVNLQFVLKTSQDIVDAAGAKIIGTQTTPSGTVSGLEASADAGRVYVLFNFKFAKQ